MSAYMVNNRTLSIIAKYMEECANYQIGGVRGIFGLEFDRGFKKFLIGEGLVDPITGMFTATNLHRFLYKRNRRALRSRYGAKEVKEMCPLEPEPMEDAGTPVDVSFENRREWLANLYTVCQCYLYQIAEGDYHGDWFYNEFAEWLRQMATALANYVVDEVRSPWDGLHHKSWDEF